MNGRIAQSVERWSNKPLVKGSSPFVTTFFFLLFPFVTTLSLLPLVVCDESKESLSPPLIAW